MQLKGSFINSSQNYLLNIIDQITVGTSESPQRKQSIESQPFCMPDFHLLERSKNIKYPHFT
jgi:hypothetical protein